MCRPPPRTLCDAHARASTAGVASPAIGHGTAPAAALVVVVVVLGVQHLLVATAAAVVVAQGLAQALLVAAAASSAHAHPMLLLQPALRVSLLVPACALRTATLGSVPTSAPCALHCLQVWPTWPLVQGLSQQWWRHWWRRWRCWWRWQQLWWWRIPGCNQRRWRWRRQLLQVRSAGA